MKKYEKIISRADFLEEKYGIRYAKTNGKLFNSLKVIYYIVTAYTFAINLLFIVSMLMMSSANENFNLDKNAVITVSACTVLLIAGFVLICTKLKAVGAALSIIPLPIMFFTFANLMEDSLGFLGYKISFYWRHAVPCVVILALSVWMLIIAIRATVKSNNQYKKAYENVYGLYVNGLKREDKAPSQEEWEAFLEEYNPRKTEETE